MGHSEKNMYQLPLVDLMKSQIRSFDHHRHNHAPQRRTREATDEAEGNEFQAERSRVCCFVASMVQFFCLFFKCDFQ